MYKTPLRRRLAIAERTRAARARCKAEGRAIGVPPTGWRVNGKGLLEVDPREQETLREARRLREAGMTLQQVADELTRLGHRSRAGTPYHRKQVSRMLAREE